MSAVGAIAGALKKHVFGQTLVRRNPFYYDRTHRLLEKLASQNYEERLAFAHEQLRKTLKVARRTEYGRSVGAVGSIESWPLLEKESLRHGLNSFTTGPRWMSAPAVTGGTTGVPLKLLRSLESIAFEQASIDRVVSAAGVDARVARTAVLRGDNPRDIVMEPSPAHEIITAGRIMTFSANAVTHTSVEHIADSLEKFQPELLFAYPSALETVCRYLAESGRKLRIPVVVTSSEVIKPAAWELATSVLGCRLVDYYGQAERIAFACATAPRNYYFEPGYSWVELIPYDAQVLPRNDGHRLYEIVGTSYWNCLLPVVRYRTGDLLRLPAEWGARELQELALGLRPFDGVLGREQEIIVCPNSIRLTGISRLPREVQHVLRIQVVQEDYDSVRIFVLPTAAFSQADADLLLANVRTRIPAEVCVSVEIATRLERTPRGKTPLIVHRPKVHDALRRQGVEPLFTR